MDPIPQMVIETPAARRKGELVITLANLEELRAQLDAAERMLLAAQRALEPEPEPAPEPERDRDQGGPGNTGCPECGVSGGRHLGNCKTGAKLTGLGERITALSEPVRTAELVPLDESLPWAASPREWCGWSGPDGEHCLLAPHGPREMHAAPVGAGSMRRWPALRSVTA